MRILIVEDEPDLLRSLAQALREEGYAVDSADNGEDGLFNAEGTTTMPSSSILCCPGSTAGKFSSVSAKPRKHRCSCSPPATRPATGCAASTPAQTITSSSRLICRELFARLRALIRRNANKTTNVIEIGDVKIDTAARHVLLKDKPIVLTAREYSLVEFLALHRGEVVTRTQLYEHLFDENENSLSNLLDVHVSNVRKKLGAEFIVTRRGHGYCIE